MAIFAERAVRQRRAVQRFGILVSLIIFGALLLEVRRYFSFPLAQEELLLGESDLDAIEREERPRKRDSSGLYLMYNGGAFDITLSQTSEGLPLEMDAEEVINKSTKPYKLQDDKPNPMLASFNGSKALFSEEESSIEKDETIDQNSINEIYQGYLVKKVSPVVQQYLDDSVND